LGMTCPPRMMVPPRRHYSPVTAMRAGFLARFAPFLPYLRLEHRVSGTTMRQSRFRYLLALTAMAAFTPASSAEAIPDFSGLWARTSLGYERPLQGRGGVENRMRRPNGASNLGQLVGDYTDPLLTPAAAAVLKRLGEISVRGIAFLQPSNQCQPYAPPYIASNNQEIQ